jgi:hypothetical protein
VKTFKEQDKVKHMDDINYIGTTTCDSCNRHGPAVVYHDHGVPVLAQCEGCQPDGFEAVARRDIDEWLMGADNFSR